jgi:D-alanyl-D-alanine carboxypeptidase/D-alanyl-D-alanine-endopeptidase (penicillin-binding protein 4)
MRAPWDAARWGLYSLAHMAEQGVRRVSRSRGAFAIPVAAVVLAIVLGLILWSRGDLNDLVCDGDCGAAYVVAPRELTSDTEPGSALAAPAPTGSVDPLKLSAAVRKALGATVLGSHVGFAALDPADGGELALSGPGAYVPASTTKVLTAFAALSLIDPQQRFSTRVVQAGNRIVLVGGGDPYLAVKLPKTRDRAIQGDLTTLARRTASALKRAGTTHVGLDFDAGLFTGPSVSPAWEPSYVSGNVVTPVSALWADQGVQGGIRSGDPAAGAARTFAGLLEDRGITVSGDPARATAPADASVVAEVRGATVGQIIETLIRTSDNQAAEVMLRQLAIADGQPASFAGGTRAVESALRLAGITTSGLRLYDGSGLSRRDRISPTTLAQTVHAAISTPRTSGLMTDLPVSGFTGTLVNRFAKLTPALGTVRAKTGTLTGVHSLAGYALDAGGRPVIFAVMADHADKAMPLEAQTALDRVAAAIATCSCGN